MDLDSAIVGGNTRRHPGLFILSDSPAGSVIIDGVSPLIEADDDVQKIVDDVNRSLNLMLKQLMQQLKTN